MADVNNISRSFADNVNYLAELDKQYYKNGFISRNGIQLGTEEYYGNVMMNVFDRDQKQHVNINILSGSIFGNSGLETFLNNMKTQIQMFYPDITIGISVTDGTGVIVDKNINVTLSSVDTIIGLIQIDISLYLSPGVVADYTKYNILSSSNDYIAILPYLATLDDDFNNSIFAIGEIKDDIVTVSDNVVSVVTVSDNIDNVNYVANSIDDVNSVFENILNVNIVANNISSVIDVGSSITDVVTVSQNIDSVETVNSNISDINNVSLLSNEVKRVSDDLNGIDSNGRSDIIIVSDDLVLGANSSLNIVSNNISDINIVSNSNVSIVAVANNIDDVIIDADNIGSINIVASDLSMSGISNIVDAGSILDPISNDAPGTSMIETVSDNIVNVNIVGENIDDVIVASNNSLNISLVADTIVPVISEVLMADTYANIAITKASEASASELMAHKWADELEDVPVVGTVGTDDEYSAYHWAKKAESAAGGSITLDSLYDVNTTGIQDGGIIVWNQSLNQHVAYDFAHNDKLSFDLTAAATVSEGEIAWNATEGTIDVGLAGGSTLQVGQENVRTVRNNTIDTIVNGRLCMFDGTIGASGRIKVKPFTAGFDEALYLYGVATQNITSGSDGIITIEGKVIGIDTTGTPYGEVWNDEDILYAKANDVNGLMTNIPPVDDQLKLVVATVVHSHATNGCLEIRFMPFNENMYYTKVQNDILLNNKVPLSGDFILDLGGL